MKIILSEMFHFKKKSSLLFCLKNKLITITAYVQNWVKLFKISLHIIRKINSIYGLVSVEMKV